MRWVFDSMHSHLSSHLAIEVENLTCGYGETIVLKKLSFSVPAGELLFIVGGSGCGKTTLLRSMIGLLSPEGGKISYFGKNFIRADGKWMVKTGKLFLHLMKTFKSY